MATRNNRSLATALLLTASIVFLPVSSFACSCAPYPEDEAKAAAKAYADADAVFLAAVTSVKTKRFQPLPVRDTTFHVLSVWKGLGEYDLDIVRSAVGEIACGYKFRKPGNYLVFAHWVPEHGMLWTNMCELTRKESEALSLIKELNRLKRMQQTK